METYEGVLYCASDNRNGCVLKNKLSGDTALLVNHVWITSDDERYSALRVDTWDVLYEPPRRFTVGGVVKVDDLKLLPNATVLELEGFGLRMKTSYGVVPADTGNLVHFVNVKSDKTYTIKYLP